MIVRPPSSSRPATLVPHTTLVRSKDLGIPIINTPNMFGGEVADVAVGYVIGLARQLFVIDRGIRAGEWPKPAGMSLAGKRSEEHTSELHSLLRISYAVFCLKKKNQNNTNIQ